MTDLADDTIRRLASRQADYNRGTWDSACPGGGRHMVGHESHEQNALVDAVAYAESFCTARLQLMAAVPDNDVSTWPKRQRAWSKHAKLALTDAGADWLQLRGYVEIRNAIQHGLGRLTNRQLSGGDRQLTLDWIRRTDCYLDGDAIRLVSSDVAACFATCTRFVVWLDTEAALPQSTRDSKPRKKIDPD
ncbi:hypothetical protein ACI2LF_31990 [Kribbella sp. NPDC020789]